VAPARQRRLLSSWISSLRISGRWSILLRKIEDDPYMKLFSLFFGFFICLLLLTGCQPGKTTIEITKEPMTPAPKVSTFIIRPVCSVIAY
jgi:hypothetical protein